MMVIDDGEGALNVGDEVLGALQGLGEALSSSGLVADVTLTRPEGGSSVRVSLGVDQRARARGLRARPAVDGGGSHLDINGIE